MGIKYDCKNTKWKEGRKEKIDTYMTEIPEGR
jgi:hypothetical protein